MQAKPLSHSAGHAAQQPLQHAAVATGTAAWAGKDLMGDSAGSAAHSKV